MTMIEVKAERKGRTLHNSAASLAGVSNGQIAALDQTPGPATQATRSRSRWQKPSSSTCAPNITAGHNSPGANAQPTSRSRRARSAGVTQPRRSANQPSPPGPLVRPDRPTPSTANAVAGRGPRPARAVRTH